MPNASRTGEKRAQFLGVRSYPSGSGWLSQLKRDIQLLRVNTDGKGVMSDEGDVGRTFSVAELSVATRERLAASNS